MKKEYICCDLCKQPIESWEKSHEYKMKKRHFCRDSFSWKKLDVHDKCMERLYELCMNKVPDNVFNHNPSEDIVHCMECAYYSDDGYCVNHSNYFGSFFYCGYGAKKNWTTTDIFTVGSTSASSTTTAYNSEVDE